MQIEWLLRTLVLFALALAAGTGAAEGVSFHDMTFKKARALAEAEDKLLFLYFSTEWCEPCRALEATTFMQPTVAAWIAEHTVALKVDGDVQPGFAKRYQVRAYPTQLLVRADGSLVERVVGQVDEPAFLLIGANALAGRYGVEPIDAKITGRAQRGPRTVYRPMITLPEYARTRRIPGHVVVRFTVTEAGTVRDPVVVESKPRGIYDRAVLNALKKRLFEPAMAQGKPIEASGVRRRFSFEFVTL
ncbi:MAG: TonB family protein [Gammaproteobacteria bacterium]|nr:TonB family protein [Gammaproteobacteria bacterium]